MKKIYKVVIVILFMVFLVFTGIFVHLKFGTDASKKVMTNIISEDNRNNSPNNTGKKNKKDFSKDIKEYDMLKKLKKINNDAVAIINVKGTGIYYPVLQSKDNREYLRKNINGNYDFNGSIFMDYECRFNKSDNVIIYGHNMESNNMFSELVKYNNKNFFDSHRDIILYGKDKTINYKVVGVYNIDVTKESTYDFNVYINRDESTDALKYLQKLKPDLVFYDKSVSVDNNSKLLTLSTCTDTAGDFRTLVVAVQE